MKRYLQQQEYSRREVLSSAAAGVVALPFWSQVAQANPSPSLKRFAFGSCNRQINDQSFWLNILEDQPDLWCSLGDNIYADDTTIAERNGEYERLKLDPSYSLFSQYIPQRGIWDDHDYASNNKGKEFAEKEQSKKLFMNFFGIDQNHVMRTQRGIWSAEEFGEEGEKTLLLLLDGRWDKERQGKTSKILGPEQWAWLEQQLDKTNADLIMIGSPINVSNRFSRFGLEGWAGYPEEKQRLYSLIGKKRQPVIILSGDRHYGEIVRFPIDRNNGESKIVYEFMSSGLTHSSSFSVPAKGRIAVARRKNYGVIDINWDTFGQPLVEMSLKDPQTGSMIENIQCDFDSMS
ncbi:MAG: hypothetical protein CMP10_19260 [Zetaproteobacteria bacterium]|nr:hypothetical protein [Pseudobdellovibrionaceae bacterium]